MNTTKQEKGLQCKIIMLPVNGARVFDNTALLMHDKELFLMQKADTLTDEAMANCQHIHLISINSHNPELPNYVEIKDTDWFIYHTNAITLLKKCNKNPLGQNVFSDDGFSYFQGACFKIIATTDRSLGLPGIPRYYIEKMVEQNNTAITDRDEWVEIVDNGHEEWFVPSDGSEGEPFWNEKIEVKFKK